MSERMLRPAVQRTEIGPILSTVVPEVLEIAKTGGFSYPAIPESIPREQLSFSYMPELASYMRKTITRGVNLWVTENGGSRSDGITAIQNHFEAYNSGQRLTYHRDLSRLIEEGMHSGVIMPLKLFCLLDNKGASIEGSPNVFTKHIIKVMRSEWFDDILHSLAGGPNGSLGSWSTDGNFDHSKRHQSTIDPVREIFRYLIRRDDGSYTLSSYYRQAIKDQHKKARRDDYLGGFSIAKFSGGCPVRHRKYKVLGEFASQTFDTEGIDPASLSSPSRKSSISLCREFVADRLEQMIDRDRP